MTAMLTCKLLQKAVGKGTQLTWYCAKLCTSNTACSLLQLDAHEDRSAMQELQWVAPSMLSSLVSHAHTWGSSGGAAAAGTS